MPLFSLPSECFNNIFSSLDDQTLYNCLFVNRYWCRFSIPIIWKDPFKFNLYNYHDTRHKASLVINPLLACLNENEVSSLIPCVIINLNNQSPLFEYGKFIRNIDHDGCVGDIIAWLEISDGIEPKIQYDDCGTDIRVQKLVNAIYHMIMRQGSNLQEFNLELSQDFFHLDLLKLSIFLIYKPGITNLRSLIMDIDLGYNYDMKCQYTIEFLSMVSTYCNGIVNCELWIHELNDALVKSLLDIIKLQPLRRVLISFYNTKEKDVKKFLCALEPCAESLKELSFYELVFQDIDISFITKFECLECLQLNDCVGFIPKHYEGLSKKKFHLKELKLQFNIQYFNRLILDGTKLNITKAMINCFFSENLLKLTLNIITPETFKAVKESCPNINFLHIIFFSSLSLDSIIPLVCELSSLKILHIQIESMDREDVYLLVKILGGHLTFVEYLSFNFYVDLPSFEYFTNNCRANLKKWNILFDKSLRKDYLRCVNNFQMAHNSLKVLGTEDYYDKLDLTNEELEIIGLLKNQGVDIVPSEELYILFYGY